MSEVFGALRFRGNANSLRMVIGAMYTAVMFIGINNCATVQPIVSIERTVFYRERAAGMYSAMPYAIAQVTYGGNLGSAVSFASPITQILYFSVGCHGDTLCVHPNHILHPHCLCHDELPMDSSQVLLVLLRLLLLLSLLHLLWYDDCVNLTKP